MGTLLHSVSRFRTSQIYGKVTRVPFGKCSVMETFRFQVRFFVRNCNVKISKKFGTFIAAIFFLSGLLLPHALSEEMLSTGIYIDRKLSHNLTWCKNLFCSSNIISALVFVDKCNGRHKSCITNNWFLHLVMKAYLLSGGQVINFSYLPHVATLTGVT